MRRIFTEYLRSLDPEGDPPDSRAFGELWDALRTALRSELTKRGLWDCPPFYLGIYGWSRWSTRSSGNEQTTGLPRRDDALEELLAESYVFIFVTRLQSLKAHLKVKPNIDGLVFLNLRHFLHDRQQEYDPLGTRVFEMLQATMRIAVLAGEIHVLVGDSKIRNDTILGFTPGTDPTQASKKGFRHLVESWNNDLLPELVTASGKARQEVIAKLRRNILELHAEGIEAFRFKDVIDPLKNDLRVRWASILEHLEGETALEDSDDEFAAVVRLVHPDTRTEERESVRKLATCVAESVDQLEEVNEKTRAYLSRLWQFLRTYAAEPSDSDCSQSDRRPAADSKEHELPSRRKISKLLGIPRDRLPGLYQILGQLIQQCWPTRLAGGTRGGVSGLYRRQRNGK